MANFRTADTPENGIEVYRKNLHIHGAATADRLATNGAALDEQMKKSVAEAEYDHAVGYVSGYRIDPDGDSKLLDLEQAETIPTGKEWNWLHFEAESDVTKSWLTEKTDIDPNITEALTTIGTRPRYDNTEKGSLLILRGVNLNPGQDPEDMVSVRLWMEPNRIITTRRQKVLAIFALREAYDRGHGPASPIDFVIELCDGLVDRMRGTISNLEDKINELEELLNEQQPSKTRGDILRMRSQTIALRRYLAPQRDAIQDFITDQNNNMSETQRSSMRLVADRISRFVEDLDVVRDRSAAIHEELSARMSEEMSRTSYGLTVVATIFLPLSLFTGLLGINVGGMPGVEDGSAFWIVTGAMVLMGLVLWWLVKWLKII